MLIFAPFLVVGFVGLWKRPHFDPLSITCLAIFGMGAILGLWWQWYRGSRTRCPECGMHIVHARRRHFRSGEEVTFHCERCNVIWETGLYVGDEDASGDDGDA